jgi:thiol-disulfide isomerase/thioredoxin
MERRDWLLDLIVIALASVAVASYCYGEPARKVTAVVYSQADCPPCLKMKKLFAGTTLPVRFEDRQAELTRQRIKSTPTTIIFLDGWPVLRVVGTLTPQQMKERLAAYERR